MPEDVSPDSQAPDTRTDAELDALADSTEVARNSERPMAAPKEVAKPVPVKEETTYEFVHNGKPVKATKDQIIKWAQQGYDYPQKAQKLNQIKSEWDKQRQDWEQKWKVYKDIDDYATKNQDWWSFIQQQWTSRGANGVPTATANAPANGFDPNGFAAKLREDLTKEFEQKYVQPIQQKQEDEALDQEIQSMRGQYKHLDWDSVDDTGKHLETRILEHAQQYGIQSFRVALRDLLADELVAKAESQGKLAVSKGIQTRTKLGVLGESPTPQKGSVPQNRNIRTTSYEDLMREAMDEVRSGRA